MQWMKKALFGLMLVLCLSLVGVSALAPFVQAAVLMTEPKMQFFDDNGDPLAGGKVYTYSAGTTNDKVTYTDQGGGTANANPVILDAAGRASIWLGTSGSYKFVVKDANDVTISTTDNITAFQTTGSTTFLDSLLTIQDNADNSKQVQFQASGVSTGTTTILTIPNGNTTLVGTGATQTLTNKTLTSPTINTPTMVYTAEAAVASSGTTDIGGQSTHWISVTGTTTITAFGSSAATTDPIYYVRFTGALTLTHNATSLILPTAANITTAAGDSLVAKYEGSGNWRVISYTKASGLATAAIACSHLPNGTVIQSVGATPYTANADIATLLPNDDTIPQNTEGVELTTVTITPCSATSTIELEFAGAASGAATTLIGCALFMDTTANAVYTTSTIGGSAALPMSIKGLYRESAGNTTARTYKLRCGPHTGTIRFNGTTSARLYGGTAAVTLVAREIKG